MGVYSFSLFIYPLTIWYIMYIGQYLLIKKCRILRHTNICYVLSKQNTICCLFADLEEFKMKHYNKRTPAVEEIQDAVEKILIESGHARTTKEFILYRAERTRVREMNTRLMKIYEGLTFQDARDNDLKRENANINGIPPWGPC